MSLVKIIVALSSVHLVISADTPSSYSTPTVYPDTSPHYLYHYNVHDTQSYSNFEANESRDGYSTTGSYKVNLPDGRVQIVTYNVDENGYHADVKYEGTPVYPEYKPKYKSVPIPVVKSKHTN